MNLWMSISGFFVGLLIGATGIGGGLLMTPILLFAFGLEPKIAVGVDLVFSAVTKFFGAWQHWRQRTIDFFLLKRVLLGSIPGTILGSYMLKWMIRNGYNLNIFLGKSLAIVFILIAFVMLLQFFNNCRNEISSCRKDINPWILAMIGFLVGFLVSITSVGSGSLLVALMLFFYPISISQLVGMDIFHSLVVTGVAGLGHLFLGTVRWDVIVSLLLGSIPGVLIGAKLTIKLPAHYLKFTILCMLLVSAYKLL